ncbi:MAG: dienelactone hydrolase family protein [bacterium]
MKQFFLLISIFLISSIHANAGISYHKKGSGYPFVLSKPKGYVKGTPMPLIVFLHGKSLSGDSLEKLKSYGTISAITKGKKIPAIVVAPQTPEGEGWVPSKILRVINAVKRMTTIDTNRIYVTGMSMGGYGTFRFVAAYPHIVAAAAPMAGGGDLHGAKNLSTVPLWVLHGKKDVDVPFVQSSKMVNAIAKCDSTKCIFTPYPKMGHSEFTQMFEKDELYEWLLAHKRENGQSPLRMPNPRIPTLQYRPAKKKKDSTVIESPR